MFNGKFIDILNTDFHILVDSIFTFVIQAKCFDRSIRLNIYRNYLNRENRLYLIFSTCSILLFVQFIVIVTLEYGNHTYDYSPSKR